MTLNDYCKLIPDFALMLRFAKQEKDMYYLIVNQNKEDLFQIIALCSIEGDSLKEKNKKLKREMYFFASRICGFVKKNTLKVNNKDYYLSKNVRKCDVCGNITNHYVYKSLIPGKAVCRICRNRIVRQDKKRNL